MPVTLQDFADVVRRQMAEIDRQRAVIAKQQAEIETLVAWIDNDQDALMALQAIYSNPNTPESNRLKAAAAALAYERPKPPSIVAFAPVKLADILDARARAGKVIEQAKPLPEALGPDSAA